MKKYKAYLEIIASKEIGVIEADSYPEAIQKANTHENAYLPEHRVLKELFEYMGIIKTTVIEEKDDG